MRRKLTGHDCEGSMNTFATLVSTIVSSMVAGIASVTRLGTLLRCNLRGICAFLRAGVHAKTVRHPEGQRCSRFVQFSRQASKNSISSRVKIFILSLPLVKCGLPLSIAGV
jgi:hypothetical protein